MSRQGFILFYAAHFLRYPSEVIACHRSLKPDGISFNT